MIKYLCFFWGSFLISSCTFINSKEDQVEILSMDKIVDKTMADNQICEDFLMSERELNKYFKIADEVTTSVSHEKSIMLPCKYKGELKIKNKHYFYEVVAAGAGYIYNQDGWVVKNYLCVNERCCSEFLNLC
ncbi:MAG: hypothetical protein COB33_009445 [Thiotrichaceae bacterium]|nr:hypothetical protein [Thiotrichaceae bacterium]PCI12010.1 MAG: hypothetical protein COB71_10820 [Thiotrichales bacterium]